MSHICPNGVEIASGNAASKPTENVQKPGNDDKLSEAARKKFLIPHTTRNLANGSKLPHSTAILLGMVSLWWGLAGRKRALGGRRAVANDAGWWIEKTELAPSTLERNFARLKAERLIWCKSIMWNNGQGSAPTRAVILTAKLQDGKLVSTQEGGRDASGEPLPDVSGSIFSLRDSTFSVGDSKLSDCSSTFSVGDSKLSVCEEHLQDIVHNLVHDDRTGEASPVSLSLDTPSVLSNSFLGEIGENTANEGIEDTLSRKTLEKLPPVSLSHHNADWNNKYEEAKQAYSALPGCESSSVGCKPDTVVKGAKSGFGSKSPGEYQAEAGVAIASLPSQTASETLATPGSMHALFKRHAEELGYAASVEMTNAERGKWQTIIKSWSPEQAHAVLHAVLYHWDPMITFLKATYGKDFWKFSPTQSIETLWADTNPSWVRHWYTHWQEVQRKNELVRVKYEEDRKAEQARLKAEEEQKAKEAAAPPTADQIAYARLVRYFGETRVEMNWREARGKIPEGWKKALEPDPDSVTRLAGKFAEWVDLEGGNEVKVTNEWLAKYDSVPEGWRYAREVWRHAFNPPAFKSPSETPPVESPEPVQAETLTVASPEPEQASTPVLEAPANNVIQLHPIQGNIAIGSPSITVVSPPPKHSARVFADCILGGGSEDEWLECYGPVPAGGWELVHDIERKRQEAGKPKAKKPESATPKPTVKKPAPQLSEATARKVQKIKALQAVSEPSEAELAEIEEKVMTALAEKLAARSAEIQGYMEHAPQAAFTTVALEDVTLEFMLGYQPVEKEAA